MLVEIQCDQFLSRGNPRGIITLNKGLNTVLGSKTGSNSIGKSTFLMMIDFAFGGNDYCEKLTDVHKEVGSHAVKFAFQFSDKKFYFSRTTDDFKVVNQCSGEYEVVPKKQLSIDDFRKFLLEKYQLDFLGLTFRGAIGRFMRIYKRETLHEERPLHSHNNESAKVAIIGLLKLCDLYGCISEQEKVASEAKDELEAFKKAKKYAYMPFVSGKREYKENFKQIQELNRKGDELARNSTGGFVDLDTTKAEQLALLQEQLSSSNKQKTKLQLQFKAIQSDRSVKKKAGNKDYNSLLRFFPEANISRIEAIEQFHSKLTRILNKEFNQAEESIMAALNLIDIDIQRIEEDMSTIAAATDLSKTVLQQYAAIDNELRRLRAANENYEKLNELIDTSKAYKKALNNLIINQLATMQQDINIKMKEMNDEIYDKKKTSPILHISDSTHYSFFTPKDSGTGSQYKGLIVFDLALLELTNLPVVVHDSVLLKHIEDKALEKIFELYSRTNKQVFIALDKEESYTPRTQELLERSKVLQLSSGGNELFGRSWNEV